MGSHLYNSRLGKVRWFVRRFGAREVFLKPLRTAFAPAIIPRLTRKKFRFQGAELEVFYHAYNMTWASERGVEVPIARHFLAKHDPAQTLEVGNVLSHYAPVQHTVLDKFERGANVINEDILTYRPGRQFDLILSISTFEHIGFDDEAEGSSAEKILAALDACKALLTPTGKLVITIPINYNPELDELIRAGELPPSTRTFLLRTGATDWREASQEEALRARYKTPFPYANAIMVAEFTSGRGNSR